VRVGYARVSRQDQRLEPQRDALLADGCERVFEEKVSSREVDRKALRKAFASAEKATCWWWRGWTG
jgi:DNA invertase Pin-like site-specific DNA recombinase